MHADSLKHHISHLENTHDTLDRKIRAMEASYKDNLTIQEMKKKKLHVKDEIDRCRHKLTEML
jgi:hypothetical protein